MLAPDDLNASHNPASSLLAPIPRFFLAYYRPRTSQMVRGFGRLSKAQRERNKLAAEHSAATRKGHALRKATLRAMRQVQHKAAQEIQETREDARKKIRTANIALQKARRDQVNAERCRDRLHAKFAQRRINTGTGPRVDPSSAMTSTVLPPALVFVPEPGSEPVSPGLRWDSLAQAGGMVQGTRLNLRSFRYSQPLAGSTSTVGYTAAPVPPAEDLVTIPRAELEELKLSRVRLQRKLTRLRKRRQQEKATIISMRSQLHALPLRQIFPFKSKGGVLTEKTRTVIRELVALGIPHAKVKDATKVVLAAAGWATSGNFDRHTVARVVREGYVAAAMQVMFEVKEADGT